MNKKYQQALNDAIEMMGMGLESRSALKEAAAGRGIQWGDEMEKFVVWAESKMA